VALEEDGSVTLDLDGTSVTSGVVEHQGKRYVVLKNAKGVLAVYRVRTSGALKRLRRWPAGLER
jgi:hypothetical protein